MAFDQTEHTALTIGSTEISLVSGTSTLQSETDDGIYDVYIDPFVEPKMAKGDVFVIRGYETIRASGTKRLHWWQYISHAQSSAISIEGLHLLHGWDITMQKVAGNDCDFDTSIRRVS